MRTLGTRQVVKSYVEINLKINSVGLKEKVLAKNRHLLTVGRTMQNHRSKQL